MQKRRAFPSKIEPYNNYWTADALDLGVGERGIDLGDHEICVEQKSRYSKYRSSNFAVHEYQIEKYREENPKRKLRWSFMEYRLIEEPKNIPDSADLDFFVSYRTIWLLDWDWIKQFPVARPKTGPYRYVPFSAFQPSIDFTKFTKKDGTIYVHKDCPDLIQRLL